MRKVTPVETKSESLQESAQSETPGLHGNSTRENRGTLLTPVASSAVGQLEKAISQKTNMFVGGESDGREVPGKYLN
jgi:hypothetical protein